MRDQRTPDGAPGTSTASRRTILVAGAGGAAAILAGCTVYGRDEPAAADDPGPTEGTTGGLLSTAEVEVGGGVIVAAEDVVVTQPTSGEFKGFSATCTHQGCTVASVENGTINCPCHGSRFSVEDGSVVQAASGLSADQQAPLPEVAITVDGDTIRLG
jgi:Rieske Fe-S protein